MKKVDCKKPNFIRLLLLSSAMSLANVPAAHADPVTPNAGQSMREIEQKPAPEFSQSPNVSIDSQIKDKNNPGSDAIIPVKSIEIAGNTVFSLELLEQMVADLKGEHTLAELQAGANRITAYYRENGYMVARAYIPAQKMEGGILTIKILEGTVGKEDVNNKTLLSDDTAKAYVDSLINPGDILQSRDVNRAMLLLADTPGVGGARAVLRPGESVGSTDLLVNIDPSKRFEGNIGLNNFGNRYTGEYLADIAAAFNNPLKIGDQLSARILASNHKLAYGRLAYSAPVGFKGLRVGGAFSATSYELGKEFESLDANGKAYSTSLYASYPIVRSLATNLYCTAMIEDKRLKDNIDSTSTTSDKTVDALQVGFSGNHQDTLGGGGVTSFQVTAIPGRLDMDADSKAIDDTTTQADGNFLRVTYGLSRLQRLTDNNFLAAIMSGQWAYKNLNSSEEFSLGGVNGVRAYPVSEGAGDEGVLGTLELRHNFKSTTYIPALQGIVFYDIGSSKINHDRYNSDDNRRTVSGAGFGVNAKLAWDLNLTSYIAWQTSGGSADSESNDRDPRFWFQLSKKF